MTRSAVHEEEEAGGQSVLDRISAVLSILSGVHSLTLAEIARRSDIPRSSLHRMLQQLLELDWVERVDMKYRLGVGIRELGQNTISQSVTHRAAIPWMYGVRDATGFHVHLTRLSAFQSVNLETIYGKRWATAFGGARQPAYATATGRMLLAGRLSTDPTLDELPELTALTRYTITSKQLLLREVHKARADEVAVVRDECRVGVMAVAVPIGPVDGVSYVLSVTGPSDQLRPHQVISHLRAAAAQIHADASGVVPALRGRRPVELPRIG